MEAHWVADELNLRVGSARNGYVLHIGSMWAVRYGRTLYGLRYSLHRHAWLYASMGPVYRLHNTHMVTYVPLYLYN